METDSGRKKSHRANQNMAKRIRSEKLGCVSGTSLGAELYAERNTLPILTLSWPDGSVGVMLRPEQIVELQKMLNYALEWLESAKSDPSVVNSFLDELQSSEQ
jgi:hypothetical protein